MIVAHPALAAIAPGPLDDLEGDPGDQRDAEDARRDEEVPRGQADRREGEDGHDHHDQQEARTAARVQPRVARGVLRRQRLAGLVAGDRLVLGAVVLEHAAQIAQPREQEQVAEEDRRAHQSLDQPEEHGGVQRVLDQAREPDGHDEEQADREGHRHDHGAHPCAARDRLLVLGQLRVGGDAQRLEADLQRLDQRNDAADDRPAQHPVLLGPGDEWERRDLDLAVGSLLRVQLPVVQVVGHRLANGHGPRGDARASSRPRARPGRPPGRPAGPSTRRRASEPAPRRTAMRAGPSPARERA